MVYLVSSGREKRMEETEESVNFITCAVWVPRGAAKTNPEKVRATGTGLGVPCL
ncbi:hypothetical protein E2C01_096281 [Portunus trituberculatus]|uniref:Uncharacterized protein n=1 Tax=Portunus trituberculatus TaxID=210409 RepID=A0A5B7JS88_PORTR|nr:hypothetical protein [Portunus trituberculatus]